MRFRGMDLNLLGVFDVLMENRSVSGAARQLGLSQPAMSAALRRIREAFGDPILVAQGKRMYPTAFAESIWPQVRQCLFEVDNLLGATSVFDPKTSQRTFRLIVSDYIVSAFIAPLISQLAIEAPGVRLDLALPSDLSEAQVIEGKADLFVCPEAFVVNDQPAEFFFEERFVIAGWSEHPAFQKEISPAILTDFGFVGVRIGADRAPSFADRQLSLMGITRRMEVETSSFTTVPWLICGTQRLAVMHEKLAQRMSAVFPLSWAPMPVPFSGMREMMQFHRSRLSDEGLKWLRDRLRAAVQAPIHSGNAFL